MGIIEVKNLEKSFIIEKKMINILKGVNLEVKQGEFLCIMGASGSGKTTLLQLLGGIDSTTKGEIKIGNTEISMMNEKELALFRRRKIGFIFQQFNLIPIFNAEENVTLPLLLDNVEQQKATNQAKKLLKIVGLEGKEENLPSQLSGGQQQRVAIARAFANDPEIILADEPTGALDSENSKNIITVLRNACDDLNQTAVVVTHDPFVAAHADRVVFLLDGLIIHEYEETNKKISEKVKRIQEIMNTHFQ
ncbi:peptide ABC transporter ATP-binding protein [Bacillus pseudomycoides]|uniref:ABC transporter ATP-binding protein n=2 Tax=Bacillus pseudomycoides TaxID=64104 RepID=UPI000BEE39D1|nr:ABC transporter ATP-binding protein [Bacillus pseudomycoides]MBD5799717.1 peptide ABC transporter ATP-binding protein [Bacillus pseudomycoides]MED4653037.1 ABC transporter ATP-binding protein [Bacillus pseudomycoides]PDZ09457.1 peptide ABC transporter ATP-binding protein [Bacillus pseudomycoides]PDZ70895.1 peptide ABC transporter ATP-binding protein [Bacillus pseudomycoides]PEE04064.1 peptide ABC transporter ATP-binding protein [Bacillus pseudomycoides]